MACERYGEALADVAAGLPVPTGLGAHLASCRGCRGERHVLQQALAIAGAEMAGLRTAEPSPELAVRIRQAVAEGDPTPQWRFAWLWPAVAAAMALLVALAAVMGRGTPSAPESRLALHASRPQPTSSAGAVESGGESVAPVDRPAPGADQQRPVPQGSRLSSRGAPFESRVEGSAGVAGPPAPDSNPVPARLHSTGRRRIPPEPEVLVPPGETEALLRFVAIVHRQRLAPTLLAAAGQPSADLAEPAAIDLTPLEIVPLDPAEPSGT